MLTAVIASYNHEKYILECLINIVKIQNLIEVFVIDDGSKDDSVKIVNDFIKKNDLSDFIKVIQKPNSGLVNSLNLGLRLCQSKYIYFTASDDFPSAEGIKLALDELEENDKDLIIGGALNIFEDRSTTKVYSLKHATFFKWSKGSVESLFLRYPNPILIQSTLFKTSYLKDINGWDVDLVLDDYSIFTKIFLNHITRNESIMFQPKILTCFYRHHGNNSYKKFLWLFIAVSNVINRNAPLNLKAKAIGTMACYYLYQCIKNKQFKMFFSILKLLNSVKLFYCSKEALNKAFNK